MSGFEVAGIVLAAFPLIISGLEHWRDVAKVGGFYWRVRKEYTACRREVDFHVILYKRNLKELLLPIMDDAEEVADLVNDPGGRGWTDKAVQERLEKRLQESYTLYMDIIHEMNDVAEALRNDLAFDKATVQTKLASPEPKKQQQPSSPQPPNKSSKLTLVKSKWDYETFRLKFSFTEVVRKGYFDQLKECNRRIEQLLSTSDKLSALEQAIPDNSKRTFDLEKAFKRAWKQSDTLFRALQNAWRCTCRQHHFANLRLEHRTLPTFNFEIILMYVTPTLSAGKPWSWKELQCAPMTGCPTSQKAAKISMTHPASTPLPKSPSRRVAFATPMPSIPDICIDVSTPPSVDLCQILRMEDHSNCIGVIGHDDETYHLHPSAKRSPPGDSDVLTLDRVLSRDSTSRLTRRQRYSIALLIASSVAQLHANSWLNTSLTKKDVLLLPCAGDDSSDLRCHEPFIRQGFPLNATSPDTDSDDRNFTSLGIILLELCFGERLEDNPLRKQHPLVTEEIRQALDLQAAMQWAPSVQEEGGDDYASAVRWCFLPNVQHTKGSWRLEIIKNVIRPLEKCQEHFQTATTLQRNS
ncbi:hypothetical protein IQ06DRAFT_297873 [Phaeosphaeriaceae sp. SRC1lsM3a]|nr:hypothetical protein IQ06DRAFT_297873 [Stagonospora sp. SRC1lsM3a]